jgi:hypothetical protein
LCLFLFLLVIVYLLGFFVVFIWQPRVRAVYEGALIVTQAPKDDAASSGPYWGFVVKILFCL